MALYTCLTLSSLGETARGIAAIVCACVSPDVGVVHVERCLLDACAGECGVCERERELPCMLELDLRKERPSLKSSHAR